MLFEFIECLIKHYLYFGIKEDSEQEKYEFLPKGYLRSILDNKDDRGYITKRKEVRKMWFRLKNDYQPHEGEIHHDSWKIAKIKKGAPIRVHLEPRIEGETRPRFIFNSGGLEHLILSDFDLPEVCVKDRRGDVFCATHKRFFYVSVFGNTDIIAKQMVYCPLCGRGVFPQLPFPVEGEADSYEEKIKK